MYYYATQGLLLNTKTFEDSQAQCTANFWPSPLYSALLVRQGALCFAVKSCEMQVQKCYAWHGMCNPPWRRRRIRGRRALPA
jgi:hypothetical protein